MAWTFFGEASRETFRERMALDAATWARGRGWALWKSLKTLAERIRQREPGVEEARRCLDEILSDHRARV